MGGTMAEIESISTLGYDGWISAQMRMSRSQSHVEWFNESGRAADSRNDFDSSIWRKLISSPDQLRQRMVFALSQIFALDIDGLSGGWLPGLTCAKFADTLETHAFGNYRQLLEEVSLSTAMGLWLTHMGNEREDTANGSFPDENFAREIMQLFTIGLVQLNPDGTPKKVANAIAETYTNADVQGLARVFTGWDARSRQDRALSATTPMVNTASKHETREKRFLGKVIPANTNATESLKQALDHLFEHPNVPPFIARQLIQRFVTSNPSPGYVSRVAAVFARNSAGVRGDLGATLRALLLDAEARTVPANAPGFGKLREPVLRFTAWARAAKVTSPSGRWDKVNSLMDPAERLGQSPFRSPSVFNFYRPGYVPPNTEMARNNLVAPEFQITTETSVAGYLNFMISAVENRDGGLLNSDLKADYQDWLPLADKPTELAQRANLLLGGGGLGANALNIISQALVAMPAGTSAQKLSRVHAAVMLTLAAPEALVSR